MPTDVVIATLRDTVVVSISKATGNVLTINGMAPPHPSAIKVYGVRMQRSKRVRCNMGWPTFTHFLDDPDLPKQLVDSAGLPSAYISLQAMDGPPFEIAQPIISLDMLRYGV